LPAARRDQAATCWLAEMGNGDKFLFDIGSGSMVNVAALMIPYDFLDKVFLTHLHTDHFGDLTTLWAGGWTAGRTKPLQVWGPSGQTPEMGTAYAIEHFLKAFNWDAQTRNFVLSPEPGKITVNEFDYKAINAVVYQENGVTIRSIPAIHEVFLTPPDLVKLYNQSPGQAIGVGTQIHTSPPAFGKVMSTIKPRHAIGYHFFNEPDTHDDILMGVRKTYAGPLTLAKDNMVWNITTDTIVQREIVSPDQAWAVSGPNKAPPPPAAGTVPDPLTEFIKAGRWQPAEDAQAPMVEQFKKDNGLK
jgi:ribonuclease Z